MIICLHFNINRDWAQPGKHFSAEYTAVCFCIFYYMEQYKEDINGTAFNIDRC